MITHAAEYLQRHGIGFSAIRKTLLKMRGQRVLVIGDLILDEYIDCEAVGMSREDPTIVVRPREIKRFVGGAGIVAGHAAELGATTSLVTVVGEEFTSVGDVLVHSFVDRTRPTTLKQRFRAQGKTMLRVNHYSDHILALELQEKILERIVSLIPVTDVLLFADFSYGCLPQTLVDRVLRAIGDFDIVKAADSQSSSQIGDVSRFKGMTLITPTEREARLAAREPNSGLVYLTERIQAVSEAENVIVTLGPMGALVSGGGVVDRLPALNDAPVEVAGAGDALFVVTAMALRTGADIWEAAYVGSLAAAVQISRIGNIPLSVDELLKTLDQEDALVG